MTINLLIHQFNLTEFVNKLMNFYLSIIGPSIKLIAIDPSPTSLVSNGVINESMDLNFTYIPVITNYYCIHKLRQSVDLFN